MWSVRCVQQCVKKNVILQNCRYLSVSTVLEKNIMTYNQQKQKKFQQLNLKRLDQARSKKPVVVVPRPVKIGELSEITNISSDRVMDAVEEVAPNVYCSPRTVLKEFKLINAVVSKLGLRCRLAYDPSNVEPPKDMDVYRSTPTTDPALLTRRPPIVTIMGHIDHGKTTLLDALRQTKVAEGEAGGITQAVGAFSVNVTSDKTITFLDTPGHAAFSSMRKRGALLTDIVILVVAADDSVMEQTIESIKAARLANVPMIVAINKCDLKKADVNAVMSDLSNHGVKVEQLDGNVQCVQISALKGEGLDQLVESIILQAEVLEVASNNDANVEGVVIESRVEKGIGPVASMVVQQGTLSKGKFLVAGTSMAKVKGLLDENRKPVSCALPGHPVNMFGWRSVPHAGDVVLQVKNEAEAKKVVEYRKGLKSKEKEMLDSETILKEREALNQNYQRIRRSVPHKIHRLREIQKSVHTFYDKSTDIPALDIIFKADVDGSLGTLLDIYDTYDSSHQCALNLIDFGIGEVQESDLEKAEIFGGSIFCFNVSPSEATKELAAKRKIPIISYDVIYHLIKSLKDAISSLLPPHKELNVIGEGRVQQLFEFHEGKKTHVVAGCLVESGEFHKDLFYAVNRDGETIFEGPSHSLRNNKADVSKITTKKECGLVLEDFSPEVGDVIQCGEIKSVPTELEWNPRGF